MLNVTVKWVNKREVSYGTTTSMSWNMWKLKVEYHVEVSNAFVAVKRIKGSVDVCMASKGVEYWNLTNWEFRIQGKAD